MEELRRLKYAKWRRGSGGVFLSLLVCCDAIQDSSLLDGIGAEDSVCDSESGRRKGSAPEGDA